MGAEIDRLEIEVEAQATKANNALDKLVGKLERLAGSLGSIKSDGLTEFASGVGNLGTAAKNMAGVKVSNFSTIANGVKKLAQLDTAQMISTADGFKHLVQELGGISGLNFDASGIVAVSNSLAKLGGVKATTGTQNLQTVKDDLAKFVTGMNSIGSLNFDIESLLGLIDSISKLGGKKATQAAQNLPPISAQLQNLVRQMNNIESLKFDVSGVENLVSSISKLGHKSAVTATANIPNLTRALLDMMNVLSKAPAVSNNIIQMTNALANLASKGSKVGSSAKSVTNSLNGYSACAQRASKSSKGLASIFGKFYANFFLVKRGVDKLWKSITTSMDYVETLNYFDAAFGQVAESAVSQWEDAGYDSADAYYKSFSERAKQVTSKMTGFAVKDDGTLQATGQPSLGIDPEKLMNYQATFGQMSSSMGVTAETALKLSQALTEIGGDLASVKNLDFDKVWNDMASGLAGMSRTLDKYGVNIRNVNLQQKLNELGIQANITALNQNDKALLRAIILLDSTRYAWGDLADTINQPANQLRLIESNFQNLSRTIGNLFLPVVSNVLPYVNAMVIALQRLATWIGNLLGIDLSKVTSSVAESSFDFGSIADEAENATEAVNQLQKGIRKFDELDVINTSSGSGSGSSGGIGSGLLDDAFNQSYEEYQKAWDEAFANMENKAQELANKIDKFFEPVKNIFTDFFEGDFFAAGQDTSNFVTGILNWFADGIDDVPWFEIGQNIGNYLAGINWTDVFKAAGRVMWEGLKGAFELYFGMFSEAPIETAFLSLMIAPKLFKAISTGSIITGLGKLYKKLSTVSEEASMVASALMGNNAAASALAMTYPKLANKLASVTSGYKKFKTSVKDKGFFATANKGIKDIRNNLTGFQKGLIGVISVAAEFVMVKDAVYDIARGSDNLVASIGQIAVAAGVAGTALYIALGPAGVAVAAITGVVAAISGINKAFDEVRAEEIGLTIRNAMEKPGGVSIDEVVGHLVDSISNAADGFSIINEKSSELDSVQGNIKNTWLEIDKIQVAMENGVLSVEEGKQQLESLFTELATLTEQKFSAMNTAIMSAYGEGGSFRNAVDSLGGDTESAIDTMIAYGYQNSERAKEIAQELSGMDINTDEYKKLSAELATLSGDMSSFQSALSDFNVDLKNANIDYSSIFAVDGTIDFDKLKNLLTEVSNALNEYETNLGDAGKEISRYWQEIYDSPFATDEQKTVAQSQLNYIPQAIESMKKDAELQVVGFTDMIQNDFIARTEQTIDENVEKWNSKSFLEKWWSGVFGAGSEGEYVKEAVENQQKNIDELSSAIETSFGDLKTDGVAWASDASKEIYGALFDSEYIYSDVGPGHTSYTLRENYKQIINSATDGIAELAAERGKDAADGYAKGVSDNTEAGTEAAKGFIGKVMDAIAEAQDSHSPSKVTQRLGKDAVDGYNIGITENTGSTLKVVDGYIGKIIECFTTLTTSFMQIGANVIEGLINGMSGKESALYDKANEMAENVTKTVQTALDIHSPSRVLFELGGYTMEGFKEGMENLYTPIETSLKALGGRVEVAPLRGISSFYAKPNFRSQIESNQTPIQIGLQSSGSESEALLRQQNVLLQRQNELLMRLLDKPAISNDDVFSAAKAGYRDEARRLGAQGNPQVIWG